MVLNGEIDRDVARTYSTLARVVTQSLGIEVARARFLKEEPTLLLRLVDPEKGGDAT